MNDFLSQIAFSLSITGPICVTLILGIWLKYKHIITDEFIEIGSKVVFQVTLPALLFLSIVTADHDFESASRMLIFATVASVSFFVLTMLITHRVFKRSADAGVIVQASFRANTGIIGIAYVANAYGESGIALAALYVAATTLLYNVLAVICLTPTGGTTPKALVKLLVKTMTKNPLIISIVAGLVVYGFSIPVPSMIIDAGDYLAKMTLPLALLCTGGSLNLRALKQDAKATWYATSFKLVLAPLLITSAAVLLEFRGIELAILFFMNAAPVAAASYVMARSMGGNATLAANTIALTTLLSTLTCSLGIVILSSSQLI
jgi:predicted permease